MSNEIQKNEQQPLTIGQFLKAKEQQISMALPRHIDSGKILRVVMTEIAKNPDLQKCTFDSLLRAVIISSQLGLIPDSTSGEAYLIPYKKKLKNGTYITECQFQPGYKGLEKLAYNSGMIEDIEAYSVYANDTFDFEYGSNAFIKHKPNLKDRGELYCFWAEIKSKTSNTKKFIVMSKEEVERHRAYSKAATSEYSPWFTNFEAMAEKTAIKRVLKHAPRSSDDLTRAITLDDQADLGIQDSVIFKEEAQIVPEEKTASKASKLAEAINGATLKIQIPSSQVSTEQSAQAPLKVEIGIIKQFENIMMAAKTKDELNEIMLDINLSKENGQLTPAEAALLREIYSNCEKKLG